jgi:hypothetical protein
MAWRPYENLINGELDNRSPGRVTGWIRFFREAKQPLKVRFDLAGDFHEDIRGKVIRLSNPNPSDRRATSDGGRTYMDGFASVQRGEVGDITAGIPLGPWTEELSQKLLAQQELFWEQSTSPDSEREQRRQELAKSFRERIERHELFYPYVEYPYIEWYSEKNGRVVLELEPEQVEILDPEVPTGPKTAGELAAEHRKRVSAFWQFLESVSAGIFRESRRRDATDQPERVNQ